MNGLSFIVSETVVLVTMLYGFGLVLVVEMQITSGLSLVSKTLTLAVSVSYDTNLVSLTPVYPIMRNFVIKDFVSYYH